MLSAHAQWSDLPTVRASFQSAVFNGGFFVTPIESLEFETLTRENRGFISDERFVANFFNSCADSAVTIFVDPPLTAPPPRY